MELFATRSLTPVSSNFKNVTGFLSSSPPSASAPAYTINNRRQDSYKSEKAKRRKKRCHGILENMNDEN